MQDAVKSRQRDANFSIRDVPRRGFCEAGVESQEEDVEPRYPGCAICAEIG